MNRHLPTRAALLSAILLFAMVVPAYARTEIPPVQQVFPPEPRTVEDFLQHRDIPSRGPMNAAGRDTVYFGYYQMINGEAYAVPGESWTFDHGASDPMEGWRTQAVGQPQTAFFRQVTSSTWAGHGNQAAFPNITGAGVAWLGRMEDEADASCWAAGLGYGNVWDQQLVSPAYVLAPTPRQMTLNWKCFVDSEANFDSLYVRFVFENNATLTLARYDGKVGDPALHDPMLASAVIPAASVAGHVWGKLTFEFTSDGGWSDEDGMYATDYGPVVIDDVEIQQSNWTHSFWGFETGLDGWTPTFPPLGPTYAGVVASSSFQIDPNAACNCKISGNVLEAFNSTQDPHPSGQHERLYSPILDAAALPAHINSAKLQFDMYSIMPATAGVFYAPVYQYYPVTCADSQQHWSRWTTPDQFAYFHSTGVDPVCFTDNGIDIPLAPLTYRFGLEIYSSCDAFGIPPSSCQAGLRNITPIFDNIRVMCYDKQPGPATTFGHGGFFADAFPSDGTIGPTSAANADVVYDLHRDNPIPDLLGDSLVVFGPNPTPATRWDARLWWRIPREGPGQSSIPAYVQWQLSVADGRNITGRHAHFTFGEMDSAQVGTSAYKYIFMSEFKETDDDFVGESLDHNEMIWDGVLTPGTQIEYFITSNYTCTPTQCYYLPDTLGGNFKTFDVLPSFRTVNGSNVYPGILVLSMDPAEKPTIERALNRVLNGVDLPIPNPAPWDIYDYADGASNWNAPFARSAGGNNGATLQQLQGYRGVILAQGVYGAGTLAEEDIQLLSQWPLNPPCGGTMPWQGLLLEGDNAADALAALPSGPAFQSENFAASLLCQPLSECQMEYSNCLNVVSSAAGPDINGPVSVLGNWCPQKYSFDELVSEYDDRVAAWYQGQNGWHPAQLYHVRENAAGQLRAVENGMSFNHLYDGSGCPNEVSASAVATGAERMLSGLLPYLFAQSIPTLIVPPCSAPTPTGSISGRVYRDFNNDCVWSSDEPGFVGWTVVLQPSGVATLTRADGYYEFTGLAAGNYTVQVTPEANWQILCGDWSQVASVGWGGATINQNFGLGPQASVQDVRVTAAGGIAKPGFATSYTIDYANVGTIVSGAAGVTFVLPTGVNYTSSPGGTYNSATRTVTWSLGSLALGAHGTLQVSGVLDTNLAAGSQLVSTAHITPYPDAHPNDNDATVTQTVVNSFDPNDKLVAPTGAVPPTQLLSYEVRFQNLGSASATNISITDVLDTDLDLATLELGPTRHPAAISLSGRTVTWTFTGIELPPASQDEAGSHGYVTFQAKPLAGLPAGTQITNQASIVFDFNPPVLTNVVTNTLLSTTAIDEPVLPKEFALDRIAPNPAQGGATNIRLALPRPGDAQVIVYDVAGRRVRTVLDGPVTAGWLDVPWDGRRDDGERTSAGIYFVRAQLAAGKSRVEKTARLVWMK
ncbi:MAG: FlgD immunoglobulin-like domain containing protein [Candidatus Eisenbacteria bacterium]